MSGSNVKRRRNEEARRQGWKCYWCKVTMTEVPPGAACKGIVYPATMVTLDHIYHKGDPRRLTIPQNGERRYVAACAQCNHRRGKLHERLLGSMRSGAGQNGSRALYKSAPNLYR